MMLLPMLFAVLFSFDAQGASLPEIYNQIVDSHRSQNLSIETKIRMDFDQIPVSDPEIAKKVLDTFAKDLGELKLERQALEKSSPYRSADEIEVRLEGIREKSELIIRYALLQIIKGNRELIIKKRFRLMAKAFGIPVGLAAYTYFLLFWAHPQPPFAVGLFASLIFGIYAGTSSGIVLGALFGTRKDNRDTAALAMKDHLLLADYFRSALEAQGVWNPSDLGINIKNEALLIDSAMKQKWSSDFPTDIVTSWRDLCERALTPQVRIELAPENTVQEENRAEQEQTLEGDAPSKVASRRQ